VNGAVIIPLGFTVMLVVIVRMVFVLPACGIRLTVYPVLITGLVRIVITLVVVSMENVIMEFREQANVNIVILVQVILQVGLEKIVLHLVHVRMVFAILD